MSSRTLLSRELRERLAPRLRSANFSFSAARLEFRRARGEFRDVVRFTMRPGSEADACQFTSTWFVESASYAALYAKVWRHVPAERVVAVRQDWHLRGWPRSSLGFSLMADSQRCAEEMQEFYESAILVGVPFLERVDSLKSAAEIALEGEHTYSAAELLALSGQHERAMRLVDASIVEVERRSLSGSAVALRGLKELRARLAAARAP